MSRTTYPVPPLTLFTVSARLRSPLDDQRPFTVGAGHLASDELAALDEFAVRVLYPFANAGFPVEVFSVTAYSQHTAAIVLPLSTTDDRRRTELAHGENVLDVLAQRIGRRIDLRVIEWEHLDRRPVLVGATINARRASRAS